MTVNEKMKLVLELAQKALEKGEFPIACIIFDGDNIISQSYASEKEDKRLLVHAELKALLELDEMKFSAKEKSRMELFTNLESCMMCLGAAISSFVGKVYYSLDASDGAAKWALNSWNDDRVKSAFELPEITSGILEDESRELFKKYIEIHQKGQLADWVKTIVY